MISLCSQLYGYLSKVGHFQRYMTVESGVDFRGGHMNRDAYSCKAASSFNKPHQGVRHVHLLQGLRENKVTRLQQKTIYFFMVPQVL